MPPREQPEDIVMKRFVVLMLALSFGALLAVPVTADFKLTDPILKDKKTGIEYALTGHDTPARQDPRWAAFPLRLEFAKGWELYSEIDIRIYDANQKPVFSIMATAPWLLLKLNPGTYYVYATDQRGIKKSQTVTVPGKYTLRW